MFGDYEAQRHWMEITYNLPIEKWYVNGTDNDLQYWGLDYPPLTAYHSWLMAYVGSQVNSSWFELKTSQGLESSQHKLFMRYTAILSDLLFYIPAIFMFFSLQKWMPRYQQLLCILVALLYPGLNLIDHGHFQYNSVSLGLAVWGVVGLCSGHDLLGSVAFVFALNYKQMELYHSTPFFCYLLGSAFNGKHNWFLKLLKLGVVVVGAFALCWAPFLHEPNAALQVLQRLFPFNRGLFEDKVANVWCSLSVLIKIKQLLTQDQLVKLCLGSTLAGLVPSSTHLLLRPSIPRFLVALVNSSLVFFLFSYQVHEKSILLVAIPVCLLMPRKPFVCLWFLLISTFSMLPLLIKDGLLMPYVGSSVLFSSLAYMVFTADEEQTSQSKNSFLKCAFVLSQLGCVALAGGSVFVAPPPHLPDLFPTLISAFSAAHFCLFLVYFHHLQFTVHDLPPYKEKASPKSSPVRLNPQGEGQLFKNVKTFSPKSQNVNKRKGKRANKE